MSQSIKDNTVAKMPFSVELVKLQVVCDELECILDRQECYYNIFLNHPEDANNIVGIARENVDNKAIGFILYDDYYCNDMYIYVVSSWRRKGVARSLVLKKLKQTTSMCGITDRRSEDFRFLKSIGATLVPNESDQNEISWTLLDYNARFARLMNLGENHNGFQYRDGMNILSNEFTDNKFGDGLYFSKVCDVMKWRYGCDIDGERVWVREVIIPPESKTLQTGPNAFKTDRFILGQRISINEWTYK